MIHRPRFVSMFGRRMKSFYYVQLRVLITSLSLCYLTEVRSQNWTKVFESDASVDFVTLDNLGNVYAIHASEIKKYKSDGSVLAQFSNISLGNISQTDVTNPLKILLFYKDYFRVQFVDNMLAERQGMIDLQQMGHYQVSSICTSFDNGFWVFDQLNFDLVRYNQELLETHRSKNINQVIGYEFIPVWMMEANNWLYLSVPEKGILVFDIYGTYYKTIPIKGLTTFQVAGDLIYYLEGGSAFVYHQRTLQTSQLTLPMPASYFRVEGKLLLVKPIDAKSFSVWKMP